ncbi:MAG: hypothetical protein ABEJ23_04365 [Haloarculaceae archaeon]
MAVNQPATEATVELRLRVPRGAAGGLVVGGEDVLTGVDGVVRAAVESVANVRPAPADIYVDATATLTLRAADDRAAVERRVAAGFGVESVATVELRATDSRECG